MPSDRRRLATALKNAAAAGDTEAVRRLTAALQGQPDRVLGDMPVEELSQLDPASAEFGGVEQVLSTLIRC
jgi:hypothetical protein